MNIEINEKLISLKERLKELRLQSHFTQKYVAQQIGMKYQSYQAYELGVALPSLESLIKLAVLFDVSTDYLLGLKEF